MQSTSGNQIRLKSVHVIASVPKVLKEASGLEITESGLLWTHNDDQRPILYALDTSGNIARTIHLNHPNKGWEDLTRDHKGNLYIGAFGNNSNDRRDLEILKIGNPDSITDVIVNAEVIRFSYPDQREFPPRDSEKNFDADAFVSIGDSLYLFTKNRTQPFTGYTKIYRIPSTPGEYEALLYDSIHLGSGDMLQHWVTSADVSPDAKTLALLSHDRLWLLSDISDKQFSKANLVKIDLGSFSHKSGICFRTNSQVVIVDELELGFLGGNLYMVDLSRTPGSFQAEH